MAKRSKAAPPRRRRGAADALARFAPLAAKMAGVGYYRYDVATGGFCWSEGMYRIYGLDPAHGPLELQALDDYVHPDDRARLREHRVRNSDVSDVEVEVRIVRADGEIRHVISRSILERDADGRILARFGALSDVTHIRRAEAAARDSEARYRFLAENAPDMIARLAPDGTVKYVSPGCTRVFGYTPEEHVRLNAGGMCHPDDLPMVHSAITGMMKARETRLPEPLRYRARHKDGRWIWVEANPTLILDEHGEPFEFVDIVRDITLTKAFEAELEEARRQAEAAAAAKAAFLANMSHELRTPLTSIIGFARLLSERQDLPGEAAGFAHRIGGASEALLAIINDVLDFSKLEAGQVALERQPLSLRRLVEDTLGLLQVQAEAKGLQLRQELDPGAPELIQGDVARLRQVLLNFLGNAVKFTERGAITVRTRWRPARRGGGRLRIEVADTGPGIAAESLPRLFERFSQAEVSINRTHGGTGLGLAICKGIIELMGGRVGVSSREGRGSTFWFSIPARPASEQPMEQQTPASADPLPLRLLIVDDTAVNRELVRLMLEPLGLQIQEADGGAEAVKAAMSAPFDLILMDVRMPGVDGLEATRVIRATSAANRTTPIVALTADVQPETRAACRAAGMDDTLAKPIVPRELLAKILQWGQAVPAVERARRMA
jgi:PAS domain S-box-containing protein